MINVFGKSEGLARMVVEPLAAGSPETVDWIVELVQKADFSGLGTIGGAVAFATAILAIGNIEEAFNQIWGIRKRRTLVRRFSDYLTVMIVAPSLLAMSLSLGTTLNNQGLVQKMLTVEFFARTYEMGLQYVPFVTVCISFAFLYLVLPNTKVRFVPAITGGAFSGVLFAVAQNIYLGLSIGTAKYSAIFGGFAKLPLLFAWIYVCWVVVLLGAAVAYAVQNLGSLKAYIQDAERSHNVGESLGLNITLTIARAFREGGAALSVSELAQGLNASIDDVRRRLAWLEEAGVVAIREGGEAGSYQLARSADQISALGVWRLGKGIRRSRKNVEESSQSALAHFCRQIELAEEDAAGSLSVLDLLNMETERMSSIESSGES
ncbi:MAG: YihY family inner membrane protein [Deltaproteobacteria bacterium]|nr:YihY family inner membrane protein [Deltaproteobacteria bacterium]